MADDRQRYTKATAPFLRDAKAETLADVLALLELNRKQLEEEFAERYRLLTRNITAILSGIDPATALASVDEDREELERRVRDLNAVAQLGITVEIIGHELENLDNEVTRNLELLEPEVRDKVAFQRASDAHRALTEKLRFLSPLQLAGARLREPIKGAAIEEYVREFFGSTFDDNGIVFRATPAFQALSFTEMRSRILPVFINLINNATYWVARSADRRIEIDYVDGKVVIGDTGPGVDRDDVWRLFQLFYTTRAGGRGVGLYLSKVNLEAGRHTIRYAQEDDPHVLPGANFVIELRGASNGSRTV